MKGSRIGVLFSMLAVSALAFGQVPIQNENQKILAFDGAQGDYFGFAIDADETTVVITAEGFEYIGSTNGAAYVYERTTNGSWEMVAKLSVPGVGARENFGSSVAIDGNTIAVGATGVDGVDAGGYALTDQGAVFVFVRNTAGQWDLRAQLHASDAELRHYLGMSVDIDGNTLIAGAHNYSNNTRRGAAYVYMRDEASGLWSETDKLVPDDVANFDNFSSRLALEGDNLFVLSPGDDDLGPSTGSVYRYERNDADNWIYQPPKMYSPDGLRIGGLALDDKTLMITGGGYDGDGEVVGAVFVYEDDGMAWVHQSTFFAGGKIALRSDRAVMAVSSEPSIYLPVGNVGAAYVFDRHGSEWENTAKLVASDGQLGDQLGYSVGISGDSVILGAFHDDDNGQDSGSAYVFDVLSNTPPVANAGPDQTVQAIYANGSADVILDGTGSSDDDGDPLTYSWTEDGQPVTTGVGPTITLALGTHTITLSVDDGQESASDDVVITVEATIAGLRGLLNGVIPEENLPANTVTKLYKNLARAEEAEAAGDIDKVIENLTEFSRTIDKALRRGNISEANANMLRDSATATKNAIGSG